MLRPVKRKREVEVRAFRTGCRKNRKTDCKSRLGREHGPIELLPLIRRTNFMKGAQGRYPGLGRFLRGLQHRRSTFTAPTSTIYLKVAETRSF